MVLKCEHNALKYRYFMTFICRFGKNAISLRHQNSVKSIWVSTTKHYRYETRKSSY